MSYQQLITTKEEIEQRRSDNMTVQHNKRIKETRNEIRFYEFSYFWTWNLLDLMFSVFLYPFWNIFRYTVGPRNISANWSIFSQNQFKQHFVFFLYILIKNLFFRDLRTSIENDEIKERSLLMNILQTWQLLKKLRENQAFINTSTTLKVRKYVNKIVLY